MLYYPGPRSAEDFIPFAGCYIKIDPNQQKVLHKQNRISMMVYITLDPDQQEPLYQLNRISMVLYNTRPWSAGDVKPKML